MGRAFLFVAVAIGAGEELLTAVDQGERVETITQSAAVVLLN